MTNLDTQALDAFRVRVRAWLAEAAPQNGWLRDPDRMTRRPAADDSSAQKLHVQRARECQRTLFDAGLAGINWPSDYGGLGLTNREQVIFNQESTSYELPLAPLAVTLGMCGPTVIAVGTEEQKRRYLPPMLSGDEIWCQLFSEPDAGSDVASLRTKAVRNGDGWVLSGQKVWTSHAHYCRFGIVLARTDPDVPKHQGLTMFVLDMTVPGIEVRQLRQMNGAAGFNEVFLNDVMVPDENVLGEVNGGWRVALVTLMTERVSIGAGRPTGDMPNALLLAQQARERGLSDDSNIRHLIADVYLRDRALRALSERINAAILSGRVPGPEGSAAKLMRTELVRRSSRLGYLLAGLAGQAWDKGSDMDDRWAVALLTAPGISIAGGTDEIMRNVIAERLLGLPKDPRVGG